VVQPLTADPDPAKLWINAQDPIPHRPRPDDAPVAYRSHP
jgi:hypothetical protein